MPGAFLFSEPISAAATRYIMQLIYGLFFWIHHAVDHSRSECVKEWIKDRRHVIRIVETVLLRRNREKLIISAKLKYRSKSAGIHHLHLRIFDVVLSLQVFKYMLDILMAYWPFLLF